MASQAELELLIRIRDEARAAVQQLAGELGKVAPAAASAERQLNGLEGAFRKTGVSAAELLRYAGQFAGFGVGFSAAQAGINAVRSAFDATVGTGIHLNAQLQTTTLQFQSLGLNAGEAQKHVADLFQFAARTPFSTEQTIEASRALRTMGGAALDTQDNLRLVGDAAASVSAGIQEVAFWTGRAYSSIQAGRPFGEAAERLQELGILSGTARNQLEAMQKAGAGNAAVWGVFQQALERSRGAMERQATTMEGLTSTLSDNIALLSATATAPLFEGISGGLKAVIDALGSDAAQQAAEDLAEQIRGIGTAMQGLGAIGGVALDPFIQSMHELGIETINTRTFMEQMRAAVPGGDTIDRVNRLTEEVKRLQDELARNPPNPPPPPPQPTGEGGLAGAGALPMATEPGAIFQRSRQVQDFAEMLAKLPPQLRAVVAASDAWATSEAALNQKLEDFRRLDAATAVQGLAVSYPQVINLAVNWTKVEEALTKGLQDSARSIKEKREAVLGLTGAQKAQLAVDIAAAELDDQRRAGRGSVGLPERPPDDRAMQARAAAEQRDIEHQRTAYDRLVEDRRRAQDQAIQQEQADVERGLQLQSDAAARAIDFQITARERLRDSALRDLDAQERAAREASASAVRGIEDEEKAARRATDAQLRGIDDLIDAERRRHDAADLNLRHEEEAALRGLDAQLQALDRASEARSNAQTDAANARRLAQARTPEERAAAQQAIGNEAFRRQQDAAREAIRSQQDALRQSFQQRKEAEDAATKDAVDALEQQKQAARDALQGTLDGLEARKQAEKDALQATLDRLNAEKQGVRDAAQVDLDALKVRRQSAIDYYKDRVEAVKISYDFEKARIEDIRRAEDRNRADQQAGLAPSQEVPPAPDVQRAYDDALAKLRALRAAEQAQLPPLEAVNTALAQQAAAQGATAAATRWNEEFVDTGDRIHFAFSAAELAAQGATGAIAQGMNAATTATAAATTAVGALGTALKGAVGQAETLEQRWQRITGHSNITGIPNLHDPNWQQANDPAWQAMHPNRTVVSYHDQIMALIAKGWAAQDASNYILAHPPSFDHGGIVPGPIGRPLLAMVHGGERVSAAGSGGGHVFNAPLVHIAQVNASNPADVDALVDTIVTVLDASADSHRQAAQRLAGVA